MEATERHYRYASAPQGTCDEATLRMLANKQVLARILVEWADGFGALDPNHVVSSCLVNTKFISTCPRYPYEDTIRFKAQPPDGPAATFEVVVVNGARTVNEDDLMELGVTHCLAILDELEGDESCAPDRILTEVFLLRKHPSTKSRGKVSRFNVSRDTWDTNMMAPLCTARARLTLVDLDDAV